MKRLFYLLLWLMLAVVVVACDGEPAATEVPSTPEELATNTPPATEEATATVALPSPTATDESEGYPAAPTPGITVTVTGAAPYPGPDEGTATPAGTGEEAQTAGLVYEAEDGTYVVGADGTPRLLSSRTGLEVSPDLSRATYIEDGDVFVLDLESGEAQNVTEESGRMHFYAFWWPARPDTLILGAQNPDVEGPSSGQLALVNTDGSDYRVVGEEDSFGLPAGGPDGERIAYDEAGQLYIYEVTSETRTALDLTAFSLPEAITAVWRGASPSWSPDGEALAMMIGIERAESPEGGEIALGIFDLENETAEVLHPYVTLGRGGWFDPPRWSPDGEWLTFPVETGDEERGIWVTAADGSSEQLLGPEVFVRPVWSPEGDLLALSPQEPMSELLLFSVPDWESETVALPHRRLIDWVE